MKDSVFATNLAWWTNRCVFTPELIAYDNILPELAEIKPNSPP